MGLRKFKILCKKSEKLHVFVLKYNICTIHASIKLNVSLQIEWILNGFFRWHLIYILFFYVVLDLLLGNIIMSKTSLVSRPPHPLLSLPVLPPPPGLRTLPRVRGRPGAPSLRPRRQGTALPETPAGSISADCLIDSGGEGVGICFYKDDNPIFCMWT